MSRFSAGLVIRSIFWKFTVMHVFNSNPVKTHIIYILIFSEMDIFLLFMFFFFLCFLSPIS